MEHTVTTICQHIIFGKGGIFDTNFFKNNAKLSWNFAYIAKCHKINNDALGFTIIITIIVAEFHC